MSSWIGVFSSKIIEFEIKCPQSNYLENVWKESSENMLEKICLCNMFSLRFFLYVLKEEIELVLMNNLPFKGYHHAYQVL